MSSIITFLLAYNQLLLSLVYNLLFLLSTKSSRSPDTSDKIDYRRFKVDSMPIINILEPLGFKVLLLENFKLKGKALKPIKKHPVQQIYHLYAAHDAALLTNIFMMTMAAVDSYPLKSAFTDFKGHSLQLNRFLFIALIVAALSSTRKL